MSDLHFDPDSILVDRAHRGKTMPFYSSDSKVGFVRNRRKVDPKYTADNVEYKFNSLGYRTCEPEVLEEHNFILFFGCSHTEGVGLHEEDIWCSQLCNEIGIQKFNLGKGSSGPDTQYLNTIQYIKNKYPMPKAVVYQWPQITRRNFSCIDENHGIRVCPHTASSPETEKVNERWYKKRFLMDSGEREMLGYFSVTSCSLMWQMLNVPVLNWTWCGDFESDFVEMLRVETECTEKARDMMHDGTDVHRQAKEQVKPHIDKLLKR